jgi:hypothetical protein
MTNSEAMKETRRMRRFLIPPAKRAEFAEFNRTLSEVAWALYGKPLPRGMKHLSRLGAAILLHRVGQIWDTVDDNMEERQ